MVSFNRFSNFKSNLSSIFGLRPKAEDKWLDCFSLLESHVGSYHDNHVKDSGRATIIYMLLCYSIFLCSLFRFETLLTISITIRQVKLKYKLQCACV